MSGDARCCVLGFGLQPVKSHTLHDIVHHAEKKYGHAKIAYGAYQKGVAEKIRSVRRLILLSYSQDPERFR